MKNFIFAHKPSGTNVLLKNCCNMEEATKAAYFVMFRQNWYHVDCVLDYESLMRDKYPPTTTEDGRC